MSQIQINFAEVEDNAFEAIPEANYPVVIDHVEMRDSKSSDNPYLNWEMTVSEGEYANRKLWMMTSLSEKALWRLKAVLSNLGVLEDGEMRFEVDDDTKYLTSPDIAGMPAIAVVTTEVYNNQTRNRVEDLLGGDYTPKKSNAIKVTPAKSAAKPAAKVGNKPAAKPAPKTAGKPKINLKR